jgi:predicted NBD/HSP70 family sugar kinase
MSTLDESLPRGTPRLLRAINERALLESLRQDGSASRADLARTSGLSKPTVSQALANLEAAGLVRAVGLSTPARGRTAQLYEFDPTAGFVVGVDIGHDWIRVAAADLSGAIVSRRDERNRSRGAPSLVRAIGATAQDVVGAGGLTWDQVAHTVVGGPGVFDPDSDRLRLAPNLPGSSRPGLMTAIREALPPSVALDNDANLAAVGERSYGRGREADTFVYATVGTGVGMGIVIDGELYRGAHGAAGEVAYLPLGGDHGDGRDPGGAGSVPRRGLLEEATSADAVVRTAKRLGMKGPLSAKRVFAAARDGDRAALAAVDAEAERLAVLVGSVAAILDPDLVLLGGGVGANLDLLRPALERRLAELTPLRPRIEEGELGQDAVVLGAIASALDTARDRVFAQRAGAGHPV